MNENNEKENETTTIDDSEFIYDSSNMQIVTTDSAQPDKGTPNDTTSLADSAQVINHGSPDQMLLDSIKKAKLETKRKLLNK